MTLNGTLRTYRPDVRAMVVERMKSLIDGVALTFGMRAEYEILSTGRATINLAGRGRIS